MHQFDHLPDSERDYWIAEWELKRSLCPDCGNLLEECADAKRVWYPFRRVCYATMEREAAQAAYMALHEAQGFHDGTFTRWAAEHSEAHPYAAMSGVAIGVATTDLAPHDAFTTEADASPVESVAQETDGEQDEPAEQAEGGK